MQDKSPQTALFKAIDKGSKEIFLNLSKAYDSLDHGIHLENLPD